ncbi:hypothetical protein A1Q1_00196 [Trichosporon asahii var. asahii CBS 2479]|uniref:Uncharacterized protein n=1 Tax=Trichosporon asahii var. asahii (strain ATCC 90039 / CBS 2479 / JCM 2466 / KCTC 7840 / NBRC 103889/ NCYC 2677 / UAMH 7654) TaxID=1186058 RepID=J5R3K9_TRIAS|nr:hypothetical protein A1Q1_00196 [Trichosporon asahii var. asahii CBS 2479]EJT50498.1 hypothetical protein A1Q1_00196 [Trichosporon asahii var. asahii CBS 2479]
MPRPQAYAVSSSPLNLLTTLPTPSSSVHKSMDGLYLDLTVMSSRTSLNRTPSHMNTTNTAPAGSQPGTGARSTRSSTRATDTGSVTSGDGGLAGMSRSFFGLNRKPRRNSASSGSSGTPPPPPGHPFNAARTSPRGSQSHPQTGLPPQGPTGQPSQASQSQASFPQSTHSTSQQSQQSQQSASQSSYSTSTSSSLPRTQSIPSSTNHPSHTGHAQGAPTQSSTGAHSTPGPHSGAHAPQTRAASLAMQRRGQLLVGGEPDAPVALERGHPPVPARGAQWGAELGPGRAGSYGRGGANCLGEPRFA